MENYKYIVFSDFDGTITLKDVGDKLFQQFGDPVLLQEIFKKYSTGVISEVECWNESCKLVSNLNEENFRKFVLEQIIDPGFHLLNNFCIEKNIPINIVSGGFHQYIKIILERENLQIPYYANDLNFLSDGFVKPSFEFTDTICEKCANCKRNHMITKSSDDEIIVYFGNGHSDKCPVRFADIVFAKGSLVKFCEMENITFNRFENFFDATEKFKKIVETTKPKKKKSAELLRKEIIMME